ncbi:MAG: sirohydrochlorin cobaltochelatase [Butyricimonas faecalis]
MFVAGDHAKNDIAGDWKEELEKKGYKVNVVLKGLVNIPQYRTFHPTREIRFQTSTGRYYHKEKKYEKRTI